MINSEEKIVNILLIVAVCIMGIMYFIDDILFWIFSGLFITVLYVRIVYFISKYKCGYILKEEQIEYRKKFRKYQIRYDKIEYIIISNAVSRGTHLGSYKIIDKKIRFIYYPWVALSKEKIDEIALKEAILKNELTGEDVNNILKDNLIYGFVWNEKECDKLLKNFVGDYYIARSVVIRHHQKIIDMMKEYNISINRIEIIKDITDYY